MAEQVASLEMRLQEAEKKVSELEDTLALAREQRKAFGFDYASKDEKMFKFYTGLRLEDFRELMDDIIGDSADNMNSSGMGFGESEAIR